MDASDVRIVLIHVKPDVVQVTLCYNIFWFVDVFTTVFVKFSFHSNMPSR